MLLLKLILFHIFSFYCFLNRGFLISPTKWYYIIVLKKIDMKKLIFTVQYRQIRVIVVK